MIVRIDTWHYKVWAWSHLEKADSQTLKNKQTSLCQYFWRVMFALVWLLPVILFLMLGKICGVPLGCFLRCMQPRKTMFHPFYSFSDMVITEGFFGNFSLLVFSILIFRLVELVQKFGLMGLLKAFLIVVVGITGLVIGVFGLVALSYAWEKFLAWKNAPTENQSLLISYLSAVKQKVCPKVEFVDEGLK